MTWRTRLIAAVIVATTVGLLAKPDGSSAEFMAQGPYVPDGIRIPGSIELLSDTAYYPAENTPLDEPEGWFAPQTVKVLATYGAWSIGEAAWKIETMFGPRWIHPKPWNIDIAPPKRLMLKEETPLYKRTNEKSGSVASLSPQEVDVVSAEKQWFYTNDPSSPAWIQIHTTWMGDLWAHIPVKDIGSVQSADKTVFYPYASGAKELNDLIHANYDQYTSIERRSTHISQTYTTLYDRFFLIDTDKGPYWTRDAGVEILPADETLQLTTEIPLFSEPSDKEIAVISGEKVTVFEKITQPLWQGRGPYDMWHFSTWYHVKTSKGTGWINLLYGEPSDAVKVHWKMSIHGDRELMRYPGVNYASSVLLLRNQDVEATAAWTRPDGSIWLKVSHDEREGWVPFFIWSNDRLWDLDTGTALQIDAKYPQYLTLSPDQQGILRMNDEINAGYVKNGVDVLKLKTVTEQLGYAETAANGEASSVRYQRDDYAFVLHEGKPIADIYWKDVLQKSVTLSNSPHRQQDAWYLEQVDMRLLLGASPIPWSDNHTLYDRAYTFDLGELPSHLTGDRAQLSAFLYDYQLPWTQKNLKDTLLPQLTIEEGTSHSANPAASTIEIAPSGITVTADTVATLYHMSASLTLAPGPHDLSIVYRVGERIVWKQPWHVVVE
ncbi:SH3 domain-containing protein [Paenibacillus roseipurpureus]|uniref:Uncharacterized protein n=1 Tax=Paenibacillus roseopurpureus TaxID=2918901 RepID=A0AA96LSY7_9BACL|nr:hypothetical protein [Paenibacillus sp. MBLB1832]WNR44155.1 hypothetical protein MJB10_24160 [Paenibacillus sp. MBLB1832]